MSRLDTLAGVAKVITPITQFGSSIVNAKTQKEKMKMFKREMGHRKDVNTILLRNLIENQIELMKTQYAIIEILKKKGITNDNEFKRIEKKVENSDEFVSHAGLYATMYSMIGEISPDDLLAVYAKMQDCFGDEDEEDN